MSDKILSSFEQLIDIVVKHERTHDYLIQRFSKYYEDDKECNNILKAYNEHKSDNEHKSYNEQPQELNAVFVITYGSKEFELDLDIKWDHSYSKPWHDWPILPLKHYKLHYAYVVRLKSGINKNYLLYNNTVFKQLSDEYDLKIKNDTFDDECLDAADISVLQRGLDIIRLSKSPESDQVVDLSETFPEEIWGEILEHLELGSLESLIDATKLSEYYDALKAAFE